MKVVLAYSGSLNSTVAIHWLKHHEGLEVITFAANLGMGEYFKTLGEHALECGASAAHVEDLREDFLDDFVMPTLRANATYESGYMLSGALARAITSREVVKLARENGCTKVAHAARPTANGPRRFQAAVSALAPDMKLLTPARDWPFRSRQAKLDYVKEHKLPLPRHSREWEYYDGNLWGVSLHGDAFRKTDRQPVDASYLLTVSPEEAPDEPETISIRFEQGRPVAVDNRSMDLLEIVDLLNALGAKHGVGRLDVIEDRVSGLKSRELYEAPAATILYAAHSALEDIVLSRELRESKARVAARYGELVYFGAWFSQLRRAYDAFTEVTQDMVDGTVTIKLLKGNCAVVGRESEQSLCDYGMMRDASGDGGGMLPGMGASSIWSRGLHAEALRRRRTGRH